MTEDGKKDLIKQTETIGNKKKKCFVVCPIGEEGSDQREKSNDVFDFIIKQALKEEEYDIIRADLITKSGKISTQIVDRLLNSDLVIADLSSGNPNVYYELAIRHATKKPFIQIAEEGTKIPFDVADMRTIFYNLNLPRKLFSAINSLEEFSKEIEIDDKITFSSPITETINFSEISKTGNPQEKMLANIMNGINNLKSEFSYRFNSVEKRLNNVEQFRNEWSHNNTNREQEFKKESLLKQHNILLDNLENINRYIKISEASFTGKNKSINEESKKIIESYKLNKDFIESELSDVEYQLKMLY